MTVPNHIIVYNTSLYLKSSDQTYNENIHNYNTKARGNIHLKWQHDKYSSIEIFLHGVKMLNQLPQIART